MAIAMSANDRKRLATPEGQATLARVESSVGEFCLIPRDEHVLGITLVALRAKSIPVNDHRPQQTSPEISAAAGR